MRIGDIIECIEQFAPRSLQEDFDNTGLQTGTPDTECTGALLCVDPTPGVVAEAAERGCNLIISHHPLFFKGVKRLTGSTVVERTAIAAIRAGIAIYSCHTAVDNTTGGVSWEMARRLGVTPQSTLEPRSSDTLGSGIVGDLSGPVTPIGLIERVKSAFNSPVTRCTALPEGSISRVAMCGGSGAFLIPQAIRAGAQAMITSDIRYHDFVDYGSYILLIDIGHYESESCTKEIFLRTITEKFPNFAVYYSATEQNPINYL